MPTNANAHDDNNVTDSELDNLESIPEESTALINTIMKQFGFDPNSEEIY